MICLSWLVQGWFYFMVYEMRVYIAIYDLPRSVDLVAYDVKIGPNMMTIDACHCGVRLNLYKRKL